MMPAIGALALLAWTKQVAGDALQDEDVEDERRSGQQGSLRPGQVAQRQRAEAERDVDELASAFVVLARSHHPRAAATRSRQYSRRSVRVSAIGIVGAPAELTRRARRAAEDDGLIARSHARRVMLDGDRLARPGEQLLEQVADAISLSRADVVDPRRLSALAEQLIGARDVADVRDVTPGVEIADAQRRRLPGRLDLRDLPRKTRGDIRGRLARSGVIERPAMTTGKSRTAAAIISCASLLKP